MPSSCVTQMWLWTPFTSTASREGSQIITYTCSLDTLWQIVLFSIFRQPRLWWTDNEVQRHPEKCKEEQWQWWWNLGECCNSSSSVVDTQVASQTPFSCSDTQTPFSLDDRTTLFSVFQCNQCVALLHWFISGHLLVCLFWLQLFSGISFHMLWSPYFTPWLVTKSNIDSKESGWIFCWLVVFWFAWCSLICRCLGDFRAVKILRSYMKTFYMKVEGWTTSIWSSVLTPQP